MAEEKKQSDSETNDANKKEPHDPVKAGKEAIEAGKIANDHDKPQEQKDKEEKEDAEKWRNEG